MSRELEFDEVIEYLRTHVFDDDNIKYITELIGGTSMEKRVKSLEELTAKMDCVCEIQYSGYKKEDWSKFWRGW